MDVRQEIVDRRKDVETRKAENGLLRRQIEEAEVKIVELVKEMDISSEALSFLEQLASGRRGVMKEKIEKVVTDALQLIYGKSYSVELTYSMKNNRSHLDIEMKRETDAGEVKRNMGGFGGGVADTISVPLRLMVLLGSGGTDKVCILDECWKHMDNERIELVGKFLRVMADRLGIQVLLCSHHDAVKTFSDRTYEISEDAGVSSVEAY